MVECVRSAGLPKRNLTFAGRAQLLPEDEEQTAAFIRIPQTQLDAARKLLPVEKEIHGVAPGEAGISVSAMRVGDIKAAAGKLGAIRVLRMA